MTLDGAKIQGVFRPTNKLTTIKMGSYGGRSSEPAAGIRCCLSDHLSDHKNMRKHLGFTKGTMIFTAETAKMGQIGINVPFPPDLSEN